MTTNDLARRLARLEAGQYATERAYIVVWDLTAESLAIITGRDEAAAAALFAAAGLAGPGFDAARIVAYYVNLIGGDVSYAAVLQEAVGPPPRGGWPRKPWIEVSHYHADTPGAAVEPPGGIARPSNGWVRPSLPYRRFVRPGVVTFDPDG